MASLDNPRAGRLACSRAAAAAPASHCVVGARLTAATPQPRNYLLFSCHASNEAVQLYNFQRWYAWQAEQPAQPAAKPATL